MPVEANIHNRPVVVSFNYTYPIFCRRFPTLNDPLVELVHQAFRTLGRPIRLADIGAAVGDTVLLIDANCPRMVNEYICVDGDDEFFAYLDHNLSQLPNCRRFLSQLSSGHRQERSLIRTHGGTASAQGEKQNTAVPLDDLLAAEGVESVDVLKIDVDGFDGEVLAGAGRILCEQQPAVIFEWHPILCRQTGNSPFTHFQTLSEAGYSELVWFNKLGEFSHFGRPNDVSEIERLADYCLRSTTRYDWHYDVVALTPGSGIDRMKLADMAFAAARPSRW